MYNNKIKKAFTLAETLITLTIVGIISALTIPTLKAHSDEAALVAQLQKAYSTIQSATSELEQREGDAAVSTYWNNSAGITNKYKAVMNTTSTKLFDDYPVYQLNGTKWKDIQKSEAFQTIDGMIWFMYKSFSTPVYNNITRNGVAIVDINGTKGPNVVGVDVHSFTISSDGVNASGDLIHDNLGDWSCSTYVIKHKKLPWLNDTSYTTCNDSRVKGQ